MEIKDLITAEVYNLPALAQEYPGLMRLSYDEEKLINLARAMLDIGHQIPGVRATWSVPRQPAPDEAVLSVRAVERGTIKEIAQHGALPKSSPSTASDANVAPLSLIAAPSPSADDLSDVPAFLRKVPGQRYDYEMTEEQLARLLDACEPTPVMFISGGEPMCKSPQENANAAWAALGEEMGFDGASVAPVPNQGQRFFSALAVARKSK